jgi:hypothetical protein
MILKSIILISKEGKFRWNKESTGPVGRLSTEGLSDVLNCMPRFKHHGNLESLFEAAYLKHDNLADAT